MLHPQMSKQENETRPGEGGDEMSTPVWANVRYCHGGHEWLAIGQNYECPICFDVSTGSKLVDLRAKGETA